MVGRLERKGPFNVGYKKRPFSDRALVASHSSHGAVHRRAIPENYVMILLGSVMDSLRKRRGRRRVLELLRLASPLYYRALSTPGKF